MLINSNEYDNEAYTEASLRCVDDVSEILNRLWESGADPSNIEHDLTSALHNSDIPGALQHSIKLIAAA